MDYLKKFIPIILIALLVVPFMLTGCGETELTKIRLNEVLTQYFMHQCT